MGMGFGVGGCREGEGGMEVVGGTEGVMEVEECSRGMCLVKLP